MSKLQSNRDPDIRRKFETWHADPRNAAAFDRVERNYSISAVLRLSRPGEISDLAAARTPSGQHIGIAAAVGAIAACLLALAGHGPFGLGGTEEVMLTTNIGEIRQVSLTDGSKVTLDSGTKVEIIVGRTERRARLKSGRARFDIAASGKPFSVEAGSSSISTTKGIMDVALTAGTSRLDVLAGAASVDPKGEAGTASLVTTRQAIVLGPGRAGERVAPEADPNWPNGMIQFAATPISEAVAIANRYSDQKILLGEGVGQLRVSGAFHVGHTMRLAKVLAGCFDLNYAQAPNGNFILSRTSYAEPRR